MKLRHLACRLTQSEASVVSVLANEANIAIDRKAIARLGPSPPSPTDSLRYCVIANCPGTILPSRYHYTHRGLGEACERLGLLRRHLVSTRAARLGTLHDLTKLAPVAIIAEALGYNPKTIEAHATASGADYARYVGAIIDRR